MERAALSISGKKWCDLIPSLRDVLTLSETLDISSVLATIVLNRDILVDQAVDYINPTIKNLLQDPSLLIDIDKAVERVLLALHNKEKITIFADYDVDGATSSAILRRYFKEIGVDVGLYIPDRIDEGYGANPKAIESIKNDGVSLVIMCDCGTTSYDALSCAKDLNLDVIVLDHHTAEIELPKCYALINPFRLDQPKSGKDAFSRLCTAGLAFVFTVALNRARRLKNLVPLPDILNYLDLVALGTVCDVMPLRGLNRAFVFQGLKILNRRENKGLVALSDVASISSNIAAYHLGFLLGPRINAGGRVGKADLGSNLLSTEDFSQAKAIAEKLNFYNEERQTIESIVLNQAYQMIDDQKLFESSAIIVGAKDWHPGVVGIVASRIKDKYNKPAIVISFDEKGEGKGSGRSIPGVELGQMMHEAVHLGLLLKGGGHSMAVGISIQREKLQNFKDFLEDRLKSIVDAYVPKLNIDYTLSIQGVTVAFAKDLLKLEPFGQGNATPKFKIENVRSTFIVPVGDGHFRITFKDQGDNTLEAMAFRIRGTIFEDVLKNSTSPLHIVGSIKYDVWNGREKASFILEDIMVAS
ncbi:MAG: Single-stranded-DNA-specific exonuclease RecJ [Holosporales bacterium]